MYSQNIQKFKLQNVAKLEIPLKLPELQTWMAKDGYRAKIGKIAKIVNLTKSCQIDQK